MLFKTQVSHTHTHTRTQSLSGIFTDIWVHWYWTQASFHLKNGFLSFQQLWNKNGTKEEEQRLLRKLRMPPFNFHFSVLFPWRTSKGQPRTWTGRLAPRTRKATVSGNKTDVHKSEHTSVFGVRNEPPQRALTHRHTWVQRPASYLMRSFIFL